MTLPIPLQVTYAGLLGCLLALVVAAATNGWSLRVFCLLALRLAIGWHFLFEGLHKVQSTYTGATDSNKPFTSEPYFAAAQGPLGEMMRKRYLGDPEKANADRLTPKKDVSPPDFKKLSAKEQADLCPDAAAVQIADGAEDAGKVEERKAQFARWVYGVDARDAKVKFVTGDVPLTAPQRLAAIKLLEKEYADLLTRDRENLGQGYGYEQKRVTSLRADLQAAISDLSKDTDTFVNELNKLAGGPGDAGPKERPIESLDRQTRWGITVIGAGLLLGLFTRLWCVAGAGFLVMTYLSHPTVPWLPLPPGTEGNPLFINKNLIEALALLTIATFPTGRWLGLDALIDYVLFRNKAA